MSDSEEFNFDTTNTNPFTINPTIMTASIDNIDIQTSNVFLERPKIYVAGEMIPTMKDKYDLLIQEQAIKAKNDKLSIKLQKQIDKTQAKFTDLLKTFKTTTDEDDYPTLKLIGENIDAKLENMTTKRIENKKTKIDNTAAVKYCRAKKYSYKKLVDLGFTGSDLTVLCGRCKLHKPYHIDFRPELPENHLLCDKGYRFSQTCHTCINKGKGFIDDNLADKSIEDDKSIRKRKEKIMNKKCRCGEIIELTDGTYDCNNYQRHLNSKNHKLFEMIEECKSGVSYIDFNLLSVAQLRHIIVNNKKPDGSNIITCYAKKNKAQLIEAIKTHISTDKLDYNILKITKTKSKAKPKKEGIVYPEFIRDDSDNDDDYDEETECLKLRDFNKTELMDFNYEELDIEFVDRPLDIDFRNDADYKDDYNDEYEYNSD
jgi:hypothetical protein